MGYIGIPPAPVVGAIYRGFLLSLPISVDTGNITSVAYQVRTSTDSDVYGDWTSLATVYANTNFNFIHGSLYKEFYYQYQYSITFSDGSVSPTSGSTSPGNGTQVYDYSGIDQLAAHLGTIQGGFLRGVVFETSANYPKVRMDPQGFFAINLTSTPVYIPSDGTTAQFTGHLKAGGLDFDANPATPTADSQKIRWLKTQDSSVVAQIYAIEGVNNILFHSLYDTAIPTANAVNHLDILSSYSTLGNDPASTPPWRYARADVFAIANGVAPVRTIIEAPTQYSSFPQLGGAPAKRLLAFSTPVSSNTTTGYDKLLYPGGSAQTNTLTVLHRLQDPEQGIGVVPRGVVATVLNPGTSGFCIIGYTNATFQSIDFRGLDGAGTLRALNFAVEFTWMAWY